MKSNSPKTETLDPAAVPDEKKLDVPAAPLNGEGIDEVVVTVPAEEPGNGKVTSGKRAKRADSAKPAGRDGKSRQARKGYRIPRKPRQVLAGHRLCPTVPDESDPGLVQQTIQTATCLEWQREGYHKCYGCVHGNGTHYSGNGLPPLDNSPSTARPPVRPESPRSPRR